MAHASTLRAAAPHFPRLVVITDWALPREHLLAALEQVCALGPRVALQHRAPEMPVRRFLEEARVLAAMTAAHGAQLFINGRLDVALLVGSHLHLPGSGMLPTDARAHLSADRWVSVAVHGPADAAEAAGADVALVSPVFRPGSKPGDARPVLGPEGFRAMAAQLPCPAYALGGVGAETLGALRGAAGVAVINGVLRAEAPGEAAARILDGLALDGG